MTAWMIFWSVNAQHFWMADSERKVWVNVHVTTGFGWDTYFEGCLTGVAFRSNIYLALKCSFLILYKHLLNTFPFHSTPNWYFKNLSKLLYLEINIQKYPTPYINIKDKNIVILSGVSQGFKSLGLKSSIAITLIVKLILKAATYIFKKVCWKGPRYVLA